MAGERGHYASGVRRREKIADAVLSIVDSEGYQAVTVARVARLTAIPESSVLYHFPTVDALLVGALRRADDLSGLEARTDDPHLGFSMEDFSRSLDWLLAQRNRRMLALRMRGFSMIAGHPAQEYFRQFDARVLSVWTRIIRGMQEEGQAHPGMDPRELALQVFALWEGLTSLNAVDPSVDVKKELLSGMRRIIGQNWQDFVRSVERPDTGL